MGNTVSQQKKIKHIKRDDRETVYKNIKKEVEEYDINFEKEGMKEVLENIEKMLYE